MSGRLPPYLITPDLILRAYAAGLFPMAESAADPALFWVDPDQRGIFPLDGLVVSRSLRKAVRGDRFDIAFDRDLSGVLDGCAAAGPGRAQTWINATIRRLYAALFARGHVHTVEAWSDGELVGGLYGLVIGGAFFGESMFHRASDASKVCLLHLAAALIDGGFTLLDAQFITPHLATLGAIEITRADYHLRLADAVARPARLSTESRSGSSVLQVLDGARPHLFGSLP